MKFCQPHWEALKKAIQDRGLWALVASSGEGLFKKLEDGGHDPLMSAHNRIVSAALSDRGIEIMFDHADGTPKCILCEVKKQAPDLDSNWLNGAADDELKFCREKKLVTVS